MAALVLTLGAGAGPRGASGHAAPLDFNRDIRPILADNCFACHGPDGSKRKAGLRLDRREGAMQKLESGARAIVPGDPAASRLLTVVTTRDPDDHMPPARTGKQLSPEQVDRLRDWIVLGAPYKDHWAYIAPERPAPPKVKGASWPRNDIDRFILSRLEHEGLKPSPEADRQTLLRRVTLDLTGLPPTIPELDAFLADKTPGAYERAVDRLLVSPAFGERMAQHWLDLARYADSDGYHADIPRSMWQYRDYVISAFNANKPFDQFTLEQLAGDLLPNPTLEQRIATAFNRNGMSSTEGGADPDEYMNKYVTDRVNTFGTVFLASSVACTECHDHKYDQYTQREYYQLYDFFNRIPERGLDSDPAPPFVKVPTPAQAARMNELTNRVAELERSRRALLDREDAPLGGRQTAWEEAERARIAAGWKVLTPENVSASSGATLTVQPDGSVLAAGTNAAREVYEISLPAGSDPVRSLRIEALTHESLHGATRGEGEPFLLTGVEIEAESADRAKEPAADELQWGMWSRLGSFKAGSAQEAFDKAFIKEEAVDLTQTYEGGSLKWMEAPLWADGSPQPLWGENAVTYLYRTIRSARPRYVSMALGSDGGIAVWLNGARVEGNRVFRGTASKPDTMLVHLEPGENRLLLKVRHGNGEHGFVFTKPTEPLTRHPVPLEAAVADSVLKDTSPRNVIDAKPETGWSPEKGEGPGGGKESHELIVGAPFPVQFNGGTRLRLRLRFESGNPGRVLGRFRVAVTREGGVAEFARLPQAVQSALFRAADRRTAAQVTLLREHYRTAFDPGTKETVAKLEEARKGVNDLNGQIPTLRVMDDMADPRVTQVRVRGDYRNKGDKVTAGVPHFLPSLPEGPTNRLALARWLVAPGHPLFGRATVNRFWALFFGVGLVKTGNEFGTQGELPSHPELLDWLARDFMDGGWDVKAFLKQIVMSATYRQSSAVSPQLHARDPENRLLARGPRFRMSAEMIRDCALDYAGLLDRARKPGGPSVRPYQPAGLWEEKMFGGNRYEESKGADLYRRSLYTLWKRTVLNPTLMTFDAPDRAICTERRSLTCTPMQAFVTLNEKGFVEAARVFASRILREGGTNDEARLVFACRTVLARGPTPRERQILGAVYRDMKQQYQHDLKGALELLSTGESASPEGVDQIECVAWTGVANLLLNLDEALTKE